MNIEQAHAQLEAEQVARAVRREAGRTVIPQSAPKPAHFHTPEPLVQIGWWGQTGRVYGLDEEETIRLIERGSYSPIYASWADGPCGHRPKLVTE